MDLDYLGTDFFKILGDSSFTFVSNNTLNGDYDPWLRSSYGYVIKLNMNKKYFKKW